MMLTYLCQLVDSLIHEAGEIQPPAFFLLFLLFYSNWFINLINKYFILNDPSSCELLYQPLLPLLFPRPGLDSS